MLGRIPVFAQEFDTTNNLVANGDAENDWAYWYHSSNTSIASESYGYGNKSFQLNPTTGQFADIRSVGIPVSPGQIFQFRYDYKSLDGSSITPGSSYAQFRSFDASGNFVGEDKFELTLTNNLWQNYSHIVSAKTGAANADIRIILGAFGGGSASGTFRFDNVRLYPEKEDETPLEDGPPLNHNIAVPTHLYVIRRSYIDDAKLVAIQTLQGIVAHTRPEIFIDQGDLVYLNDMVANHGVTYTRNDTFSWYMTHFKSHTTGYVLFDFNDPASLTAATSMAGILNAVAVNTSLKSTIESYGYSLVMDVRGKNDKWVYDNYWQQFNHDAIIVHVDNKALHGSAYYFRDWGPAIKALSWWNSSSPYSNQVYSSVNGNSPVYGWDDAAAPGELNAVELHSSYGLYQVPSDWLLNLSTFAGMGSKPGGWQFTQKIRDKTYTTEPNVHYVAFELSDMDNILTLVSADNFNDDPRFYGNSHRGEFAMGWGMPPSLVELAPTVVDWWYSHATDKDCFSAPCTGLGYMYPHLFTALSLAKNVLKLEELMEKADLKTLVISDKMWPAAPQLTYDNYKKVGNAYAGIDDVKGMFYIDVNGDYARYGNTILWFKGKPLVTCRYTLWNASQYEGISRTGLQLANTINSLPKDPSNPASYSFVFVHAWSYGLDEVYTAIQSFAPHVRVVTPEELIEQIYMNLGECGRAPLHGDLNLDCKVDFEDFAQIARDWLQTGSSDSDLTNNRIVDMKDLALLMKDWLK